MQSSSISIPQVTAESPQDEHYWLALNRMKGVGPRVAARLLSVFASPTHLFNATFDELKAAGVADRFITQVRNPDWKGVEADLTWQAARADHHILTPAHTLYPTLLKELPDAPLVLYVNGAVDALNLPQIAMVGSRSASPSGLATAREFAAEMVQCGLVITSGLALGIDASAHEGALSKNGNTLAILGTGPDRIYPSRHLNLAERVKESGAIISEFVPGTTPRKENFPRRNRLISGLSLGTLVVEATERSGSLITARFALEQGREVFAVPGSIRNPQARGCHALIREGAKLVECVQDVFDELEAMAGFVRDSVNENQLENVTDETGINKQFLHNMGYDPISVDELVRRSGLTASDVSSMLLTLELQGHVALQQGGMYQRLD